MMQQLATQSSQIAALPEGKVNRDAKSSTDTALPFDAHYSDAAQGKTGQSDSFADVFHQQGETAKPKTANRAAQADTPTQANLGKSAEKAAVADASATTKTASADTADAKPGSGNAVKQALAQADESVNPRPSSDSTDEEESVTHVDAEIASSAGIRVGKNSRETDIELVLLPAEVKDSTGLFSGMAAGSSDETDYLALVDAVRALQAKLDGVAASPVVSAGESDTMAELLSLVEKTADSDAVTATKETLLTQVQQWLNAMTSPSQSTPSQTASLQTMPADESGNTLQPSQQAQHVLTDLLSLIKQVKGADKAGSMADELTSKAMADIAAIPELSNKANEQAVDTAKSDKVMSESALPEEALVALAAQILKTLDGVKAEDVTASTSTVDVNSLINAESVDSSEFNATDVIKIDVAEDAIVVATETDETVLNQAHLLVSLIRQIQQSDSADQPVANNQPETSTPVTETGMEAIEALLTKASDTTISELAQVMTDSAAKASPNLNEAQLTQLRGQLVTGMEEIRAQLKQGHEPAIDLTALVSQTLGNVAPDSQQTIAVPVMQDIHQLTQLAGAASLATGQEQQLNDVLAVNRDTLVQDARQNHGDTQKSIQQQAMQDKPVPVNQPQGQQQLAEKIRWMVSGRQSMAEIRLDPPEMGSMQIRLNVSGDSASVSFVVQSQHAKEALADAMPRLRDMLSEQGLNLGESFVSQQHAGEQGDGQSEEHRGGGFAQQGSEEPDVKESPVVRQANGLIDDYV